MAESTQQSPQNDEPVETPSASTAALANAETRPSVSPNRESRKFRQELLSRLPILAAPQWQSSETLDIYQDLQGVVDLDADAFLEPLSAIVGERHE